MTAVRPQYTVYVIELDVDALADKDRPTTDKAAVYVGHTAHQPSVRLGQHQAAGERAGKVFKKMADPSRSWLRCDLAIYAGPYVGRDEARKMEKKMHNRLLSEGYAVFGDKGKK